MEKRFIFINFPTLNHFRFDIKPVGNLQVSEMGTAFLHCQASGIPTPTIQWDKTEGK